MKVEDLNQEVKDKVMQLLNDAPPEKKSEAIMQSIKMMQEDMHEDLINQVVAEAERAKMCIRDSYKPELEVLRLLSGVDFHWIETPYYEL